MLFRGRALASNQFRPILLRSQQGLINRNHLSSHWPILSNRRASRDHSVLTASVKMTPSVESSSQSQLKLSVIEESKRLAAYAAVDQNVKPEDTVIGIGSGSTVPYVVERIIQHGLAVNQKRVFIPTGFQSRELIVEAGLNLGDVDQYAAIDVTIDGADECDKDLNCIKGGGACHLREKVVAEAAKTFVVVADYRKNVEQLGTSFPTGVPIEVVSFAYGKVLSKLREMGATKAGLRMALKKAGPVVTDNGNFVIDASFPQDHMLDPAKLLLRIKLLTGVVEVGLFCNMVKAAYFGNMDGTVTIRKNDGTIETGIPPQAAVETNGHT